MVYLIVPTLFQDIEVLSFQFIWKPLDVLEPDILDNLDDDTCADLRGKSPLEFCQFFIFLSYLYFRSCGAFSELLLY